MTQRGLNAPDLYTIRYGRERTIRLRLDNFLDVQAPPLAVGGGDFALSVFVTTSHDLDGISFADGNTPDIVLCLQLFAQVAAHYFPSKR